MFVLTSNLIMKNFILDNFSLNNTQVNKKEHILDFVEKNINKG